MLGQYLSSILTDVLINIPDTRDSYRATNELKTLSGAAARTTTSAVTDEVA